MHWKKSYVKHLISSFCWRRSLRTTLMMRSTSLRQQRTRLLCSLQLRFTPLLCLLCHCQDPHICSLWPASQVRLAVHQLAINKNTNTNKAGLNSLHYNYLNFNYPFENTFLCRFTWAFLSTTSKTCVQSVLIWFLFGVSESSSGFKVGRHSLSYIQEIGNGWFGQVSCFFFFSLTSAFCTFYAAVFLIFVQAAFFMLIGD